MRTLLIALSFVIAFIGDADAARKKSKVRAIPEFSAKSYLVADTTGYIFKEQNIDTVMPIASISKLMVGLLASEQNLDEDLVIPSSRSLHSSIPRHGVSTLTRRELLTLALVKSDNFAAQILCDNLPDCTNAMNTKAMEIGMASTHFVEPTGLSSLNVSTASDLLKLMIVSFGNPIITHVSSMPLAEIGKIKIKNTNPLTKSLDTVLSKTGYTRSAGGCLVMIVNASVGQRILILLGSRNSRTRIPDMERLVKSLD